MKQRTEAYSRHRLLELGRIMMEKVDPSLTGVGAENLHRFMEKVGSPAPRLTGPDGQPLLRWQDERIEKEIPRGASVLDLGCGGGELLAHLMQAKKVRGQGVEFDAEAVLQCIERGVPVFQIDIDKGLAGFPDKHFDYVILEETLQTLGRPDAVLAEMLRVGRRGIVSFPNFAYWRVRLDLGLRGRMPVTEWLPYRWYDTPNIHNVTLQDFLDRSADHGVRVLHGHALCEGTIRPLCEGDNLYAEEVLLVIEKED